MRIYITHCSHKKDDALRGTGISVPPDQLYTAQSLQRFMRRCRSTGVHWAIFSDLYGVWFPKESHLWYNKDPGKVTEPEFRSLLNDFATKLSSFGEIRFYHNPGRFHALYRRLIDETSLADRVQLISHLEDIG